MLKSFKNKSLIKVSNLKVIYSIIKFDLIVSILKINRKFIIFFTYYY